MIKVFKSEVQNADFYAIMGRNFASLNIAKELERQVYNAPYTTWYVETVNNIAVAFVSVCEHKEYYFIDNLFVHIGWRNKGYAKQFIERIVNDFTDKPIKCIANNPYALKIFHGLGFVEVGKNGKYKKLVKY